MKFVLGDDIYKCKKAELPTDCYYFDYEGTTIYGKFGDLYVTTNTIWYKDEKMVYHGPIFLEFNMDVAAFTRDLMHHNLLRRDTTDVVIDDLIQFLRRHKKVIDAIKAKIFDFYIAHKPITTKSSRN